MLAHRGLRGSKSFLTGGKEIGEKVVENYGQEEKDIYWHSKINFLFNDNSGVSKFLKFASEFEAQS